MAKQEMIPLGQVQIEGAGNYHSLLAIQINSEANAHGRLSCRMRLEEDIVKVSEESREGKEITATLSDGTILFCGICTECRFSTMSEYAEMELTVKSYSILADQDKHSKTFQDAGKTISNVFYEIFSAYNASLDIVDDMEISDILVQDGETDWAFIVRVANQFGMDVYVDATLPYIRLQIGAVNGKSEEAGDNCILLTESKNLEEMRLLNYNEQQDYATYQFRGQSIQSYNAVISAGNQVNGNVVKKAGLLSDKGGLVNRIDLQKASYSRSSYQSATATLLSTRILSGEVIEVKEGEPKVKVKFDVDSEQDSSTAQELPYENVMNNSFYCMPDVHDKVYAYVDNMGEAVVLGSKRTDTGDCFFDKPEEKAITSLDNMIQLKTDSLALMANREAGTQNENTKISIELNQNDGISVHATGNIFLTSLKDVTMVATKNECLNLGEHIERLNTTYNNHSAEGALKFSEAGGDDQEYKNQVLRWFGDVG